MPQIIVNLVRKLQLETHNARNEFDVTVATRGRCYIFQVANPIAASLSSATSFLNEIDRGVK